MTAALTAPLPRPRRSGLTLLEVMIGLAILVILGSMAVPSFSAMVQHRRLVAVARHLAADLRETREEAIRLGQTVQLVFGAETAAERWCYAVVAGAEDLAPGFCAASVSYSASAPRPARLLKRVSGVDHPGVSVLKSQNIAVAADGVYAGRQAPSVAFANLAGEQLQVRLNRMGRATVCVASGVADELARCQ